MLAARNEAPDPFAAGKQYNVKLDTQGHTVSMQLEPKAAPALLMHANQQVFLSTEQIAQVASRIANEMNGRSAPDLAPAHGDEGLSPHLAQQLDSMQGRIDELQTALKFEAPLQAQPLQTPVRTEAHLELGLRHHAEVLRATQQKLDGEAFAPRQRCRRTSANCSFFAARWAVLIAGLCAIKGTGRGQQCRIR